MFVHRAIALCLSFGVATATMTTQVGAATILLHTPASNTIYSPGEQIRYRGNGSWNKPSEPITYDVDVELRWGEGENYDEYVIVKSHGAYIDYDLDGAGNKSGTYSFSFSYDHHQESNLKATQYFLPGEGLQEDGYALFAIPYRKHGPYFESGYRIHSGPLPIRIQ